MAAEVAGKLEMVRYAVRSLKNGCTACVKQGIVKKKEKNDSNICGVSASSCHAFWCCWLHDVWQPPSFLLLMHKVRSDSTLVTSCRGVDTVLSDMMLTTGSGRQLLLYHLQLLIAAFISD